MQPAIRRILGITALSLTVLGCGSLTDPLLEASFEWGEVEDPSVMTEGVEPSVLLGELFVLGHVQTPTRCYSLEYDFDHDGSQLNLRIDAETANTQNCDESLGGFRYILRVFNLRTKTYQLTVTHVVENDDTRVFTRTVTIR